MSEHAPLSPNETALLRAANDAPFGIADTLTPSGLSEAQAQSSAESLFARELLERTETVDVQLRITDAGRAQAEVGVPELRMRDLLVAGSLPIKEVQALDGLDRSVIGSAFGGLKKSKLITVDKGSVSVVAAAGGWSVHEARQALLGRLVERGGGMPWSELDATVVADVEARLPGKRGKKDAAIFERVETRTRTYTLTANGRSAKAGLGEARPRVAQLTADMLKDGSWREVEFRQFNLAEPPWKQTGRRNPYREFLDEVKVRLLTLGFEEMSGSVVEPELWNMDALFLPQFHPAREIHDVYFVENADAADRGFVYADRIDGGADERVALEHEGRGASGSRGWNYAFDRDRTKRLVLRSQGTALSARWLQKAKVPGKYFGMARCFRYDTVDATHAPDFFQVEGIVVSEQTSFRHLLGLLSVFAREMARSEEVKFVPAYFPFTEPSVEVHMKHPRLGWVELGGAGIFRPEVTRPHGVTAPVIAWGLGLDRMAMVALGIDDIRHLFTNHLPGGVRGLREQGERRS